MMQQRELSSSIGDLIDEYDNFIFDCDGVIWQGGQLISGVKTTLELLRNKGKKYTFVTNTSSRSRSDMWSKFADLGLSELTSKEMMHPSCYYAARVVKERHPDARRIYVIGGRGIVDELSELGITCVTEGQSRDCGDTTMTEEKFRVMADEMTESSSPKIDGIVLGWDLAFSFNKLCRVSLAFELAQNDNFFFYATNDDMFDQIGPWRIPATGTILASLNAVARMNGREEAEVLGKPNPDFLRFVIDQEGFDASRSIVIGDRLDTDILMAKRAGVASCLALSGCCSKAELAESNTQFDGKHNIDA
ncbi:hypothetical protein FOL47_005098 [Perkinsus chesapeaki]|uniref:4-nitrophenylphosphatase n=1 Tax=Perkinsus chesapeaki TaxID=330153 RepID=A0A7J6LYW9_PERCH|nr:hypothetical protein FOL47_005098 [Perkinsus chesapeaki]